MGDALKYRRGFVVWTETDDKELKYGKLYGFTAKTTLAEEYKIRPPRQDIWPQWTEGIPSKLSRRLGSEAFVLGRVNHRYRPYYETVEFSWSWPYSLPDLRRNKRLLPNHSSGVYRIFVPSKFIDRCCGKDPTGTLYLGRAGTKRNWSNLRTRIKAIIRGGHHAIDNASYNKRIQEVFPAETLAVQWACFGKRILLNGKAEPAAELAEIWLLANYRDSFGEYPPWNEKG
jgi:hypothetical protein